MILAPFTVVLAFSDLKTRTSIVNKQIITENTFPGMCAGGKGSNGKISGEMCDIFLPLRFCNRSAKERASLYP